jgi:hypothetical protein
MNSELNILTAAFQLKTSRAILYINILIPEIQKN